MADKNQGSPSEIEWSECGEPNPPTGTPVSTACGGSIAYSPEIPCIEIRGKRFYFCLPICKQEFQDNPRQSCMAIRLQEIEHSNYLPGAAK